MLGIHTMRNQILVGFMLVMAVVLGLFGVSTYSSVSMLLKNNSSRHIEQTAVQANGRLDALLERTNALTAQVMTDSYVQNLLLQELKGNPADFTARQGLLQVISQYQAYSSGVNRIELYAAGERRLFPMDGEGLSFRISAKDIAAADAAKGQLVWLGVDPKDSGSVLALRRMNLVDRWYSHGGYLLISVHSSYFDFTDPYSTDNTNEWMILADHEGKPIASNRKEAASTDDLLQAGGTTVTMNGKEYIVAKQSSATTGWTLLILTPVQDVMKGISVLRTALVFSGAAGFCLFLILSYVLSRLITRPILQLIKTMRGARDGVLRFNPAPSRTMELKELNHTYNQMADNLNSLIKLVYEKETLQSRSELKALQAQINPHFLYNTLEAFYWSLSEKGEEELADLVINMSQMFRYVIKSQGDNEWVTIGDELEHIERYLQLMRMRMGDKLAWRLECRDAYLSVPVPKLLIQPLVENAIVHGIERDSSAGLVTISVKASEERPGMLTVAVADNGAGLDSQSLADLSQGLKDGKPISASKGTGMGVWNVKRRLELYYSKEMNPDDGLAIESKLGEGTIVSFVIPYEEELGEDDGTQNDPDRG